MELIDLLFGGRVEACMPPVVPSPRKGPCPKHLRKPEGDSGSTPGKPAVKTPKKKTTEPKAKPKPEPKPAVKTPKKKTAEPKPDEQRTRAPEPISGRVLTGKDARDLQEEMLDGGRWNRDQREALTEYTTLTYLDVNDALRGTSSPTLDTFEQIQQMKSAMRPLGEPVQTFRNVFPNALGIDSSSPDLAEKLQQLTGSVRQERGFSSTSFNPDNEFDGSVRLEMEVSPEVEGAFVHDLSDIPEEAELILQPGVRYEFLGYGGKKGNRHVLRVRVHPPRSAA